MPIISLSESAKWVRHFTEEMPKVALNALHSAALRMQQDLQNDSSLPSDRRTYAAGWRVARMPYGADVYNVRTHAIFIEESVQPENVKIGRAMIEALTEWAKRKGLGRGVTKVKAGKKRYWTTSSGYRLKKKSASIGELVGIAWAIAKTIKKRGIFNSPHGLKPLANIFREKGTLYVEEEFKREIARAFMG